MRQGLHGVLIDNTTKLPVINASVNILESSAMYSAGEKGHFWVHLAPGSYIVTIQADGYDDWIQVNENFSFHKKSLNIHSSNFGHRTALKIKSFFYFFLRILMLWMESFLKSIPLP